MEATDAVVLQKDSNDDVAEVKIYSQDFEHEEKRDL